MKCGLFLFVAALLAVIGVARAQVPVSSQPPATILIIRHAEKLTDGRQDLSETGYKRAASLPKLFDGSRVDLPVPQYLFATHLSKHSNRPVETITPLAAVLKLPVDSAIMDDDYAALAKELLSGKYAGKVVLVAWHHGRIPQLAVALGTQPPYTPWPEGQFDRIWRIDYRDGKAVLRDLPQELLPGDSK
jgi:hypothetical protein